MPAVFVVWRVDVADNAFDCVDEQDFVLVPSEDMLDVLIQNRYQLNTLLLNQGIPSVLIQCHHIVDNRWPLILNANKIN